MERKSNLLQDCLRLKPRHEKFKIHILFHQRRFSSEGGERDEEDNKRKQQQRRQTENTKATTISSSEEFPGFSLRLYDDWWGQKAQKEEVRLNSANKDGSPEHKCQHQALLGNWRRARKWRIHFLPPLKEQPKLEACRPEITLTWVSCILSTDSLCPWVNVFK